MNDGLLKLAAAELDRHLTSACIEKAFGALPPAPSTRPLIRQSGQNTVCALQVQAKVYQSLRAMVVDIDRYLLAAVRKGAGLVCFPELYGLFAAFASPLVQTLFKAAFKLPAAEGVTAAPPAIDLPRLYEPFAFLPGRYLNIMARFARRYGVWLSCGSVFTYEQGRVYNRHTLLNPQGKVAGVQDKLHLVPEEIALGLSRGKELTVVETPFGNLALTVCMDATYFETFKIAKALGADLALVPIANMEPYNHYLALRGAAMRVSETGLAALKPALVSGTRFPVEFTGRAGVYYPLGFAQHSRETGQEVRPALLLARMNIEGLRRHCSEEFCLPNRAFNQNLMNAYQSYFASKQNEEDRV